VRLVDGALAGNRYGCELLVTVCMCCEVTRHGLRMVDVGGAVRHVALARAAAPQEAAARRRGALGVAAAKMALVVQEARLDAAAFGRARHVGVGQRAGRLLVVGLLFVDRE